MGKPRCCLCGKKIDHNQHYFIMMGRTVCREDALKIKAKRYEIKSEGSNSNNGDRSVSVGIVG